MKKGILLSDTRSEVMQVIWNKGGTIMFDELGEELEDRGREWRPNTALVLLSRPAGRGIITVCKWDRLNECTARVAREECQQKQTCILTERVFGGDARHLIPVFVRQDYLIREDYDELRVLWEKEGEGM